jgi:hypothetical protein
MKTRTDLLNHLAEKYNLQHYLEIGVQNPDQNFNKIKIRAKQSVDPNPDAMAIWCETSDEFFEHWKPVITLDVTCKDSGGKKEYMRRDQRFDLIFIDGLHTAEQVKKDFENALKILSPNGFIVLHDTSPETYERTIVPRPTPSGPWNGDVYKFASTIPKDYYFTVDIDNGTGVFRNIKGLPNGFLRNRPNWQIFNENRKELLNLISWDEFIAIGS